jgi:hypothetical protein
VCSLFPCYFESVGSEILFCHSWFQFPFSWFRPPGIFWCHTDPCTGFPPPRFPPFQVERPAQASILAAQAPGRLSFSREVATGILSARCVRSPWKSGACASCVLTLFSWLVNLCLGLTAASEAYAAAPGFCPNLVWSPSIRQLDFVL